MPMESTAGLADGFSYIGDINLKQENSFELTAGLDWSNRRFRMTPGFYYRDAYFITVESVAASTQHKVSAYNQEKPTPGWGQ